MKTGILLVGRVFLVAMLSLVLASPVFAGDAQDNDKKDAAKTFSTLKNLDKEKAKSLNEKELNKVTGGKHHGALKAFILGSVGPVNGPPDAGQPFAVGFTHEIVVHIVPLGRP